MTVKWLGAAILEYLTDEESEAYNVVFGYTERNSEIARRVNLLVIALRDVRTERDTLSLQVRQLREALLGLKKALGPDGDYSVCRSDKEKIGFCESFVVGAIFETADAALAATVPSTEEGE